MKSPSGERFTLYCAKATAPETALRFKAGKQFAAFYWVDDKVAYVVSGPDQPRAARDGRQDRSTSRWTKSAARGSQ